MPLTIIDFEWTTANFREFRRHVLQLVHRAEEVQTEGLRVFTKLCDCGPCVFVSLKSGEKIGVYFGITDELGNFKSYGFTDSEGKRHIAVSEEGVTVEEALERAVQLASCRRGRQQPPANNIEAYKLEAIASAVREVNKHVPSVLLSPLFAAMEAAGQIVDPLPEYNEKRAAN